MAVTLTTSGSLNTTVDNYAFSILSNTSSVQLGTVSLKLVVPGGCTIKNVNAGTSSISGLQFLQKDGNLNVSLTSVSNWVVNTNDVILSITASGMSTGSFTLNTDEDWYCEIASSSAEPFTDFAIKMPSLASPYASVSTTLEAVSILSGVNPSITAVGAPNSSVFGSGSRTLGTASIAEGIRTLASGLASHAAGINTTASGQAAFSMGIETDADGMASFAAGSGSWARGTATVAMGIGTIASASGQTVVGHYNLGLGDFNNLFVVGGGSGATTNLRKNLFRVYGGSGASTVGVEINTSQTQNLSTIEGFSIIGNTTFQGNISGSVIVGGSNIQLNDDSLNLNATSSFTILDTDRLTGPSPDFNKLVINRFGINFDRSNKSTSPGSKYLWTNSSDRLFYGSSAVILNDGNTLGGTMTIGTTDANNLQLETNNTTRIFISSSGNVGIGTSSPTERLYVDGNLLVTGRITAEEFHTEFVSASIIYQSGSTQFGNSLDDTHIFTGSLSVNGSITGSLFGTASWATNALTASNITPSITNNTDNRVLTATGGGTINGETNLTFDGSVLTVTGRANISTSITSSTATIGFGLTSALNAGQTTIRSSGVDTVGALTIQNSGGTGTFTVLNGGTTGVGENNPSARLHVKGSGATSSTTALRVENSSAAARLTILDDGTSAFNTNHLYVSGSGLVGIGTTNPSASLHIQGNLQISTGSLYTYGQNTDIDSGSIRTVMSVATGSYRAAFFDYVLNKSTNARAGTVFSVWNGTSVEWNDVSTNDIGNTTEVNLSVGLSGANVVLYASSSTNDWSMKALSRML